MRQTVHAILQALQAGYAILLLLLQQVKTFHRSQFCIVYNI